MSSIQRSVNQHANLPSLDFRAIFEAVPGAMLVVLPDDPVFTIIAANDAFVHTGGVLRENMLGRGIFDVFPDSLGTSGVGRLRASFQNALATRRPDRLPVYRYDLERPATEAGGFGERYWAALNTPVLGADGRVAHILHSVEELTDKVRAEQRERVYLRERHTSDTRFRQLAETSTFGLVIGGLDGTLSYLNSTVRELLGYTEQDAVAGLIRWDQLTPPEFAASDAEAVRQLITTGRCAPYEKAYIAKDGRRVPILVGASLLESVNGRTEVAAFILDLTERKRAEQRDAFLVRLDDAMRPLTDPDEIMQAAVRLLGRHLRVDRCTCCIFEADEETFDIIWDYTRPGMPSLVGRYTLTQFDAAAGPLFRANLPYVVEDVESDPRTIDTQATYRRSGIRAHASAPLQKDGRLAAAIGVHQQTRRQWRPEEIELVQVTANRCWESIERANVTRELQASERRLRLAQRAGRIGSFEWLMKENQVIWTPELEALYELREGAFEGNLDAWNKRAVAEDAARVIAGVQDCLAKQQTEYSYEFRAVLPDGGRRWLRGQSQFFYDATGAPERMLGVNIDIDAQKQAEADLHRQWRIFDTVLSNTPDYLFTFDLEGRLTYVNRALLSLWQKPLEQIIGKNCFQIDYPPELARRLQQQVQQVIDTKELMQDRTPYTDPTGDIRHHEYIFAPVFAEHGKVVAVAGSSRDITERERLRQELAASKERLQRAFAQAPVAILVLRGHDFIVELANPFYQAMLQDRELLGRRFADVVPELGQPVWDAFNLVLDTGEPFIANEWLIPYDYDRDGVIEDHWFNVVYNPLREPDGVVSGLIAVLSEVTAQVRARKELERLNRELEEFAYVASHDLQEPLRMVNIYTQLLLRTLGTQDVTLNEYASFVRQGVLRMQTLIHDLLTFSRTVHRDELPVGAADLSASLSEALSVLKNRIEESGATIIASPLPTVRGDAPQLTHVFQNLISNSLKYRNPNLAPEISISAARDDHQWIISVRDNGIGFEQQYAERIFGLFKRLHKEEYPGTGLGLAICQRIIERYGGRMWAEGKLGNGATFYFSLPMC